MASGVQEKPTVASIAVATAIISFLTGYFIGQGKSIGLFGGASKHTLEAHAGSQEDDEDSDISDAGSDHPTAGGGARELGDLKSFRDASEEFKLVLVVRNDLGMTKGKIAAQCSHATLACYKALKRADPSHPALYRWERLGGQAKVALKVDNEEDMLLLQAQAVSLGLCAQVIHDAGRTQIASGSATVCGIGPGPRSVIDQVTGHLKLL